MKSPVHEHSGCCLCRRDFLQTMATAAGTAALLSSGAVTLTPAGEASRPVRSPALVRGAFLYPPSRTLREEGYYSWPGSSFDAEGHQKQYAAEIQAIEKRLGMRIQMDAEPLDSPDSVARFIGEVKQTKPNGLLLIPFKKGHWEHVLRIIDQTQIPSVVMATLGVLLIDHINNLHRKPGVYLISAMDDLGAVEQGMRMIRTAHRMRQSLLLNLTNAKPGEVEVPLLGTRVRTVALERFYDLFKSTETTDAVRQLAAAYLQGAKERVEPTEADVLEAARASFALKAIIKAEGADAIMMNCLPGLRKPHKHVPPCMGFMTLRDEGIPAGCQSDLNATLTMMLVQELFGLPGFQQNSAAETEANHYFGAHCTSPSKMNGPGAPPEPMILRSHAEAGWGCVPQVLFPKGQEVTMALYQSGKAPRMLIYSGNVVRCYPKAAGGCRTNIEMTINEVEDTCQTQGMHQAIFYGNHARALRTFCQLHRIEAVS
ncbi:MAG: hypothetical protein ACOX1P_13515 [Thermoguttaceae bacterium]|jgi:hypothetical protein